MNTLRSSLTRFCSGSWIRLFSLLGALLCSSAGLEASVFSVTREGDLLTCDGDLSGVSVNTVTGRLEGFRSRLSTEAEWTESTLRIAGVQRGTDNVRRELSEGSVTVDFTDLGDCLLVRSAARFNGIYWNLWYALRAGDPVIEGSRFVYGESKNVVLNGIGLECAFAETAAMGQYSENAYSDLGGGFLGGQIGWTEEGKGWNLFLSNMRNHSVETLSNENMLLLWCRGTTTNWGTRIDYRRFALAPAEVASANSYARLKVNDHSLSNVELVGSWVVREKNRNGSIRDWFNADNNQNSFFPGTGSASTTNLAGFWRDDWTTGSLLRQIKLTYDVTGDVFYLMRFFDLMDYQIDRDLGRLKSQWGLNNAWQENYPFSRLEAAVDAYEITGWESYLDVALNSLNWFLEYENFVDGAGHNETYNIDYLDMSHCFEGFYRADAYNGNKWRKKINDYWRNIDRVTWDANGKLYGHNLGGGVTDHWARGHGWWYCAFPNVMDFYDGVEVELLRTHHLEAAGRLIALQNGTWHRTVDQSSTFLDSSAGSLIASGFLNSVLRGELGADALEASFEAIETLYRDELQTDGTITGTDRGARSRSNDPFPYTQEGFVRFARDLGVAEILDPSDRSMLYGYLSDGVLVLGAGGALTDADGVSFSLDGRAALSGYADDGHRFELTGVGHRVFSLGGFEPETWISLVDETHATKAVKVDSSGVMSAAIELEGRHHLRAVPRVSGAIWADLPVREDGLFFVSGFGWIWEASFPWVWIENAGWCWVKRSGDELGYWYYRNDNAGWQWTHPKWDGWFYDYNTATWQQLSD